MITEKDLCVDLVTEIERKFQEAESEPESFSSWCVDTPIILDGQPFAFEKHEYLILPYADNHPDQTFLKATQLGLSSLAMLRVIYGARFKGYRGILYLFPSRTDVSEFSKGRVDPLISDNPESIGRWLQDTDSANLKKVWNAFLYFRGMRSTIGLKSVPVDYLILDELDEAPQQSIKYAKSRMAHSVFKHILKLSNPTLPDYGVDREFQTTDQRYWLLKCPKCNKYTCMEDTFPGCLKEVKGKVIRACEKCKAELNPSVGQWVAKQPSVTDRRGYHFSQLFSHFVLPADILKEFRTTTNLTLFYNLIIGRAWVEAVNRLSVQEVMSCCGSRGNATSDSGPTYAGVDQGKDLHVVISKIGKQRGEIVHIGIYKEWNELDKLMKIFNVSRCVVDALPETRNARAFAERHKIKVFLNYYNIHQKALTGGTRRTWS